MPNFNKNKLMKPSFDVILTKRQKTLPIKRLCFGIKKSVGRDKFGQLTFHRGGGVKRKYRLLNLNNTNQAFRILQTVYNPYSSNHINLIQYKDGSLAYSPSSANLDAGLNVIQTKNKLRKGSRMPLGLIPTKSLVSNVQTNEHNTSYLAVAAGTYCKIFKKTSKFAQLILPSGQKKTVKLTCFATLGINANADKKLFKKYKAGTNRYLNRRPTVRGVAMNPIDHPHGGGEGKSNIGRAPVSPWGKLTKGVPTKKR